MTRQLYLDEPSTQQDEYVELDTVLGREWLQAQSESVQALLDGNKWPQRMLEALRDGGNWEERIDTAEYGNGFASQCGEKDCPVGWHKDTYIIGFEVQDGVLGNKVESCDSDGDWEYEAFYALDDEAGQREMQECYGLDAALKSYREYHEYVAETGLDPLDEIIVPREELFDTKKFKVEFVDGGELASGPILTICYLLDTDSTGAQQAHSCFVPPLEKPVYETTREEYARAAQTQVSGCPVMPYDLAMNLGLYTNAGGHQVVGDIANLDELEQGARSMDGWIVNRIGSTGSVLEILVDVPLPVPDKQAQAALKRVAQRVVEREQREEAERAAREQGQ